MCTNVYITLKRYNAKMNVNVDISCLQPDGKHASLTTYHTSSTESVQLPEA